VYEKHNGAAVEWQANENLFSEAGWPFQPRVRLPQAAADADPFVSGEGTESAEGSGSTLLFMMGPHADDLYCFLIFNNLVNQLMLNINAS
jgi:hypothetical protein